MNNFMSFQDLINARLEDEDVSLDSNRQNLDCNKFEFSPDKISGINAFDASVKSYKMLPQHEIENLYHKLETASSYEQTDIKNEIFFGTKKLIHNYLVSRSKYVAFKDEPISIMISDGEDILWTAIDDYNISMGSFSSYLFNLFIQKTIDDLNKLSNDVATETTPSDDKPSQSIRIPQRICDILAKLKGKSIKIFKKNNYDSKKSINLNTESDQKYTEKSVDDFFTNLDEYEIEKGKVL